MSPFSFSFTLFLRPGFGKAIGQKEWDVEKAAAPFGYLADTRTEA